MLLTADWVMVPRKTAENPGPATIDGAECPPHLPVRTALKIENYNYHTAEKGLNELSKGRKVIMSEGMWSPRGPRARGTHVWAQTSSSPGRETVWPQVSGWDRRLPTHLHTGRIPGPNDGSTSLPKVHTGKPDPWWAFRKWKSDLLLVVKVTLFSYLSETSVLCRPLGRSSGW